MIITAKSNISNTNETITLKDITFQNDKSNNAEENTFKVSDSSSKIRIPSKDNLLKSLTISNISFSFNENNTNYQLETKETSVTIKATAKDSNATVTGDIGTKNLKYGGNNFSIQVTSESDDIKIYSLNIVRHDSRSKENYLTGFEFNNYDLKFDKDKTDYDITLENNVNKLGICNKEDNTLCINLDRIKVSDKSTYSIKFNDKVIDKNSNVENINIGNNTLQIIVKAENDGERIYTFNINRMNEESKPSDSKNNNDITNKDKTNDDITNNSKTGDALIIGISLILILSISVTIVLYRKKIVKDK